MRILVMGTGGLGGYFGGLLQRAGEDDAFVARGSHLRMRASLYHDLAAGRRIELDALSGAVVRLGREAGVPTPSSVAIVAALRPYERRAAAYAASG